MQVSLFAKRMNRKTDRANSSSPGGIFTSKHLMTWLAFNPELRAMTPAISSEFIVKSRCSSDVDSGRNSANAMAPAEVMEVDDRKRRLSAVLSVNAVRSD